jgi:hypothetical protein
VRKYVGRWWTPSRPDDELLGTLTVRSGEGPSLELITDDFNKAEGSLASLIKPFGARSQNSQRIIVHGQEESGTVFTLYDGFVRNSGFGMASVSTATIYFNRGIEGGCVDSPLTIPVDKIYARYPGMDAWLAFQPFEIIDEWETKRVTVSHAMAGKEYFTIDDNRRLALATARKGPTRSIVQNRIGIRVVPWFGIEYAAAVKQEQALDDLAVVGDLLSMFFGAPTAARSIELFSASCMAEGPDAPYQSTLHFLAGASKLPRSFHKWTPFDVLISFTEVKLQFSTLLKKWFDLHHKCWGAIVPYLAHQRSPGPFAETRFFDFASVAESVHAHFRPDENQFSDEEARAICKALRSHIPKQRRHAFASALQRVNGLTYKHRLEALLKRFPTLMADVIGDPEEQAIFCKLVKDLRNVEAHKLHRTDGTEVGGSKLNGLAAKLKVVLDAWILAEIGLAESAIEESMRRNHKYWFYASCSSYPWNIGED